MIGLEETHRGGERAMCISIQQDALTAELYVSVRDAVGFYHYDREDAYGAGWWAVFRGCLR